jgi:prevent-host-death family protein
MEKKIGAYEARRQFGQVIQEVAAKGTLYIVERHGQPMAAVVPMYIVANWAREREKFFDQLQEIQRRANLSEDAATAIAAEAVAAVREEERAGRDRELAHPIEARP